MKGSEPRVVEGFDDIEDPDEAVVLEMEDAPRRKRLFQMLVSYGHPAWKDEELPPPSAPPRRKTYAEELEEIYPNGLGSPPVKVTRYGR